jgi:hypothetical protein
VNLLQGDIERIRAECIALTADRDALRAELAEAVERCDNLETAVRDELPEVTCDADGNLETNEVCRIETVGLLYTELERKVVALRSRCAVLAAEVRAWRLHGLELDDKGCAAVDSAQAAVDAAHALEARDDLA